MAHSTTTGIPWFATFETNNEFLDAQHRKLLEGGSKLKEFVLSGGNWVDVQACIDALVRDCVAHFDSEERLLQATGFPRCAEHAAQHRRIENMLEEFATMVARVDGNDFQHRELAASLQIKILDIIVRHDPDYKLHLFNLSGR